MFVRATIPIPPKPASRPRFTCRGRFAVAYSDKPYAEWIASATALLKDVKVPQGWDTAAAFCMIVINKVLKPKTSKLTHPKPDVDNYAKSIMDAVTKAGHLWDDDCQVVSLRVSKMFVEDEAEEGVAFALIPTLK